MIYSVSDRSNSGWEVKVEPTLVLKLFDGVLDERSHARMLSRSLKHETENVDEFSIGSVGSAKGVLL